MATERYFSDVMQDIRDAKKTGALFVGIRESSEDLIRIYFKNGEIYYLSYGSAIGQDCMDIIEYYTWQNATFFEELTAPEGTVAAKFPTDKFIALMKKTYKKVRLP
jgi:hypothetical protein